MFRADTKITPTTVRADASVATSVCKNRSILMNIKKRTHYDDITKYHSWKIGTAPEK